jgi:hypothetical protein
MGTDLPSRRYRCSPSRVRTALEEVRRMGATVEGNESEGTVRMDTPLGVVEAAFTFDGEQLEVLLTKKPAMVPAGLVWQRLDAACGPPIGIA